MIIDFLQDILRNSIAIFTIMNPLSVGVIMLGLLDENASKMEVRQTATKTTRAAFIAMVVTFLLGTYIFDFFGISPDGLRIFGGTILFVMGLNMVQGHGKKVNHTDNDQKAALKRDDISVVPLAIPVMVGAGLATTLINLSIAAKTWQDYLSGAIAIIICSLAALLILRRMPFIRQTLGDNGLKVFNRIMGLIVGSLAAQMILSGMFSFYHANFV
ncbi:MAG: multiple antibiotic resistance protein [Roseivirga sp.]|jgi:multiple antibiotic resistance protein